eukprot:NODE_1682_length_2404_cov_5.925780.p1 GENE.NODE_1682_length_2404_cov_5.925780~~NODE_1682_length_2404_cov_5.925780.p1  ORF type:complete len:578 (+),score=184.35 NODE_1682_length_2404_cov_5.925780:172-1905(+)
MPVSPAHPVPSIQLLRGTCAEDVEDFQNVEDCQDFQEPPVAATHLEEEQASNDWHGVSKLPDMERWRREAQENREQLDVYSLPPPVEFGTTTALRAGRRNSSASTTSEDDTYDGTIPGSLFQRSPTAGSPKLPLRNSLDSLFEGQRQQQRQQQQQQSQPPPQPQPQPQQLDVADFLYSPWKSRVPPTVAGTHALSTSSNKPVAAWKEELSLAALRMRETECHLKRAHALFETEVQQREAALDARAAKLAAGELAAAEVERRKQALTVRERQLTSRETSLVEREQKAQEMAMRSEHQHRDCQMLVRETTLKALERAADGDAEFAAREALLTSREAAFTTKACPPQRSALPRSARPTTGRRSTTQELDKLTRIRFSIGGETFETSKATLLGEPGTLFHTLASHGSAPGIQESELPGEYFIDRDAQFFGVLLNYLRDGSGDGQLSVDTLRFSSTERKALHADIKFYQVGSLMHLTTLPVTRVRFVGFAPWKRAGSMKGVQGIMEAAAATHFPGSRTATVAEYTERLIDELPATNTCEHSIALLGNAGIVRCVLSGQALDGTRPVHILDLGMHSAMCVVDP